MFSSNPLSIEEIFTCRFGSYSTMGLRYDPTYWYSVWWCSFQANQNIPLPSYFLVWDDYVVELFYHSYYSSNFSDILFLSFLIQGSGQPFVTYMSNTYNYPTFWSINDA